MKKQSCAEEDDDDNNNDEGKLQDLWLLPNNAAQVSSLFVPVAIILFAFILLVIGIIIKIIIRGKMGEKMQQDTVTQTPEKSKIRESEEVVNSRF